MKILTCLLTGLTIIWSGCSEHHLITDKKYLENVEITFNKKQNLAFNRNEALFNVFSKDLSTEQTEGLKYLYAYMPLNDLAEFDGDFFLANTDIALRTRKETPWGEKIPLELFLHYVLPCRVNNENLDSFRIVYSDEISERIKGLEIEEAALEINHWCHEKVTYQPSDIRTSGPMSTILSARGRCGEESTFTVAALRTAGIPARQVYTPRWAHTDDNHAWVEIWIDGKWYYMGACEPEPLLDMGWFKEPARRAMLVHTKSFGAPWGNENVIKYNEYFTDVNNLSKYAETKRIYVKVTDTAGNPVNEAAVEFQLYNYAEFYPLARLITDSDGISSFETGNGDLLVWAEKENIYGYSKISVAETDTLKLMLDKLPEGTRQVEFDLAVPALPAPYQGAPSDLVKINAQRVKEENRIRQSYIDSWISPEATLLFARQTGCDTSVVSALINKSMGNYKTITSFLINTPQKERDLALALLGAVSEKDLRDTHSHILSDHLKNVIIPGKISTNSDLFISYVLNPRVDNEMLVAWRGYLRENLPPEIIMSATGNPSLVIEYVDETLKITPVENHYNTPLTPRGVHELKVADNISRSVYFVSLCRSLGIPARLEPGSKTPQYYFNSEWKDVWFADQKKPSELKGYLKLVSDETNPVPEYYIHFTIARFENGRYNTLEYDFNKKVTTFDSELQLTPGHYMLVTGNRLNDSRILSDITFFDLSENQYLTLNVRLRHEADGSEFQGKVDMEAVSEILRNNGIAPEEYDNGLVIAWIEPEKEPTKHFLNDLARLKDELDKWRGSFLFLTNPAVTGGNFSTGTSIGLPAKSLSGVDNDLKYMNYLLQAELPAGAGLPVLILIDKNGLIRYKSNGYRIGTGELILKNAFL